jgi:predicted O-methyltransferase YrrM
VVGLAAAADYEEEARHGSSTIRSVPLAAHRIFKAFSYSGQRFRHADLGRRRCALCDTRPMSAPPEVPAVVARAFDVSRRRGFVSFCRNETGRLLATLAATRAGTLAEFGTGTGVGTAWLRSGVRGSARIVSAELDSKLAGAAAEIFVGDDQVEVVAADWSTLRDRGPFSLLFLDAREPKDSGPDAVVDLVEPGGLVVLDDFTPCESWPPVYGGRVDNLREGWLTDERFTTVEVMVAADTSVLIATKR